MCCPEYLDKWCKELDRLFRRAREAHDVIYQSQGVMSEAYVEGQALIREIETVLKCVEDVCYHATTRELEMTWQQGLLLYQRKPN